MKTHENFKNRKPYRKAQRSGHKKHLDGALPWHGEKSPRKATLGSKTK